MLNPLIQKHPADTLHQVFCTLSFLESLPEEDASGTALTSDQAFGYFCIIRCLKDALRFEIERASAYSKPDSEPPHPAKIVRQAKAIKYPRLKNLLLSEFLEAIDRCNKPEPKNY